MAYGLVIKSVTITVNFSSRLLAVMVAVPEAIPTILLSTTLATFSSELLKL